MIIICSKDLKGQDLHKKKAKVLILVEEVVLEEVLLVEKKTPKLQIQVLLEVILLKRILVLKIKRKVIENQDKIEVAKNHLMEVVLALEIPTLVPIEAAQEVVVTAPVVEEVERNEKFINLEYY